MKTFISPSLAALLLAATPAMAALDFTLQHKALPADGISMDQVYITDGESKIFFRVPPAWKVSNSAQSLDFVPDTAGAMVHVEPYAGPKLLTIDQAGGRDLLQQATAQLPHDAKNPAAYPAELNPLPLFGWQTLEVAFRYDYFGAPVRRSVMYLSMIPGRVVQMTVIAPESSFAKVHKQACQLMGSWFEPSRDLPPDLRAKYDAPMPGGS